jgi:septum formation protein
MESTSPRLYLASQSPRRAELLRQIGLPFQLLPIEVDETPLAGELPADYVVRVAAAKSRCGWQQLEVAALPPMPVLGADTAVVLQGRIMGKPVDRQHGLAMLESLSGQTHQVMTALSYAYQGREWAALNTTEVTFRTLSAAEIAQYWRSGEPLGKAGAYAIQGFAAVFVEQIKGSYSAVVGLPLLETSQLLQKIEKTMLYE